MEKGPLMLELDRMVAKGIFTNAKKPVSCLWGEQVSTEMLRSITQKLTDEEKTEDIIRLALTLRSWEEYGDWKFTAEEGDEVINGFRVSCVLLLQVRDGLMVKADDLSLFHPDGSWKLTKSGEEVALGMIHEMGLDEGPER